MVGRDDANARVEGYSLHAQGCTTTNRARAVRSSCVSAGVLWLVRLPLVIMGRNLSSGHVVASYRKWALGVLPDLTRFHTEQATHRHVYCFVLQLRDALFPALVAIGYCDTPEVDAPDWISVGCAKDAAKIIVDSGADRVDFRSADSALGVAVALAKGVLHGDVDAARKLLIDRRAQLRMRMDGAILRYRKENELAQRGFSTNDRISSGPHQACLASMRHVLTVARRAGLGEGDWRVFWG